ncbi:MAG TPA: hypothetical protein H9717_06340 [Candidatus Eisenbergiella merdipullorum]|uniref:DUF3298 domain-containing protein n=1 Tax=Candidatus Eisenbergiella merdipullorum TaxID=2838553 RepID=A0A9D2I3Q0_9FIRM|nr:hypothetical protein [Candidatus Eisenbergiella merdipullorum]
MYDAHEEEYEFCPKCGALTKNGVCMSCGWRSEKAAEGGEGAQASDGEGAWTSAGQSARTEADQGTRTADGPRRDREDGGDGGFFRQDGGSSRQDDGPNTYGNGWNGNPNRGSYGPQGSGYGPQGNGYGWNGNPNGPGYGSYGTEREKGNQGKVLAAVVITVLAVLICITMVLVFFLVKNSVRTASIFQNGRQDSFSGVYPDGGDGSDGWFGQLPYEYETPRETEPEPEEDYVPSADDDYYVTLADAVRDDLSYSIEWEEYDLKDDETGATAVGRYPQLVGGNIPQRDELNELIETEATYYSTLYEYYRSWQGDNVVYNTESMGYVTYMDEEKISIVLEESYVMDAEISISLYSINIDLISGEVMDNGSLIEYDQQLAEEFRSQSDHQNGPVEAVDGMDDDQLIDFLSDQDTNIVFYTPVGLEIGFNYTTSDSTGWVTATIKDYDRYVTKF